MIKLIKPHYLKDKINNELLFKCHLLIEIEPKFTHIMRYRKCFGVGFSTFELIINLETNTVEKYSRISKKINYIVYNNFLELVNDIKKIVED